jgi:hypothetical protein
MKETETWDHPVLGRFVKGVMWSTEINVPAFDAFSWPTKYKDPGAPNGKYGLGVCSATRTGPPLPAGVALAERILREPEMLLSPVTEALWDDFNGRGPDSGMWWHGKLDQVAEHVKDNGLECPNSPKDLLKLLRLEGIWIVNHHDRFDSPLAVLTFWALFEEEHGVGVLTDGDRVLGLGYSIEPEPFSSV